MRRAVEAEAFRHRINNQEGSLAMPVDISELNPADVFVREGAPCMVISPTATVINASSTDFPNHVWIVNLVSGRAWPVPRTEQVYPAFNVGLQYKTGRRDG